MIEGSGVPEKMDLRSHDLASDKREQLKKLFPEVFTEGSKIDFDRLKLSLGETVDVGKERYGMNWPGKAECFKTIQRPSLGTLIPKSEESVNFDTSKNLIIEGDNLEVLKLLQKSYLGKVKVIYIDPPYNTGNDFIYPDNYSESLQTYLEYSGQIDSEGRKFSTNTETDGRFHSKWMNMMYPRLYLGRNLLAHDGIIMISIDDAEVDNLRKLCNEIFGEENFVAQLVWEKGRKNDAKFYSVGHEYVLIYAKSLGEMREKGIIWREEKPGAREIWEKYLELRKKIGPDDLKIEKELAAWFSSLPKNHPSKKWSRYRRVDSNGPWRDRDISWPGGDGPRYDVIHPKTGRACKVPERGWIYSSPEEMQRQIQLGFVEFRADDSEPPFRKAHIKPVSAELEENLVDDDSEDSEEMATQVRGTYFYKQSQVSVKYLRKLMDSKVFNNPKDHVEILKLIRYVTSGSDNALVLDFFGGSGTTAESVIQLNAEDRTNHQFVIIQLPEPCNPKEKIGKIALSKGYLTIADITKERVRRVIEKLSKEDAGKLGFEEDLHSDRGFKVFKLAGSNFKQWNAEVAQNEKALTSQLDLHVDHIVEGRSQEDILFEILLKSGYPLTTPVEKKEFFPAGSKDPNTYYSVAQGSLLVCLEKELTPDLLKALAERKPERVVCLDTGFAGNDQLKTNAVQTMKTKGVVSFRTV